MQSNDPKSPFARARSIAAGAGVSSNRSASALVGALVVVVSAASTSTPASTVVVERIDDASVGAASMVDLRAMADDGVEPMFENTFSQFDQGHSDVPA